MAGSLAMMFQNSFRSQASGEKRAAALRRRRGSDKRSRRARVCCLGQFEVIRRFHRLLAQVNCDYQVLPGGGGSSSRPTDYL